MGQSVANDDILVKIGPKRAFSDAIMTSYSKMMAFSDFENASNVFLVTFPVVYGRKLEQKLILAGSNFRKWRYFAQNR